MAGERILIVDDEKIVQNAIKAAYRSENMEVSVASGGFEAISLVQKYTYDLILLDILMPDMDGFEVIRTIRTSQIHTPIILLSGKTEEYNKILGLGLGADDYITKPFSIALLISKSKALMRRNNTYCNKTIHDISLGPFSFCHSTFKVYKNDVAIPMTAKELTLFKFFLENPKQVFTKEQLYQKIWNHHVIDDNTIMVYIKRIRSKIEDNPKQPYYLKTIWGIGYQFDC
ncbi:DNA-binding response regulator [Anaerocolumna cellulosilytica]|uniref:Stage 0 sporulation protein A homolog n=1 Tax=Anaerocolumna cellulosilytica TaxID=433286 RepID=A0A6S6R9R5_9FIRM|nr:response regulator transcription factor [Anaerocolumna cellulosilytica]MBB5195479.1 DNA-binding response OmpR family regulator [Anaerocolumna cellulosilytica]BCJ96012.1 DNA-binding response regulator [Anaerocolumna cellulosilytica]